MSEFLAEFPVKEDMPIEKFKELLNKWIIGMPKTGIDKSKINIPLMESDSKLEFGDESLHFIETSCENFIILGIQYKLISDEMQWTTNIVGSKNQNNFWVSVNVTCDAEKPIKSLPTPLKPYIIKTIFSENLGGKDSGTPTTDKPIYISKSDIPNVTHLLSGNFNNHLPFVYISAMRNNGSKYQVDPNKLARKLSGLAHVIVETTPQISFELSKTIKSEPPHSGSIGIYWPDQSGHEIHSFDKKNAETDLVELTYKDIVFTIRNRRTMENCNWQKLFEINSENKIKNINNKIKTMQEETTRDIEIYIDENEKSQNSLIEKNTSLEKKCAFFGEKISALEEKITTLNEIISSKNTTISELRNNLTHKKTKTQDNADSAFTITLNTGSESSYYSKEIESIIIESLINMKSTINQVGRKMDIINSIINNNDADSGGFQKKVKDTFTKISGVGPKEEKSLEEIGFSIASENKHVKIIYMNDNRYSITIAKTPSDHRASKNNASDIMKILFQ